jgi:hypothetical protein
MNARRLLLALAVLGAFGVGVACSLNPQPLPPGSPDGSLGLDSGGSKDGASSFGDAGNPPPADAGADVEVPGSDASANDAAATDAEADAGDAETDAGDAATDADDASADATIDAADQ